MLEEFKGKWVAISGAAEGIGRALSLAFARAGLNVAMLDVNEEALSTLADEVSEIGRQSASYVCDIGVLEDVRRVYEAFKGEHGDPAIVWANAGVGSMGGILSVDQANLDWIYNVNVHGVLNLVRTFASTFSGASGAQHIGITASVSGYTAPGEYAAAYGASKFAVVGIGEALRAELAQTDVGVTILCPGLVNTRIWDAGKARPERFGGKTEMPEAVGDRWRDHGMSVDWVADHALQAVESGGGYISPVDPHSLDDYRRKADEIIASFRTA